ncbi:hypothetical protein DL765_002291 [Monosporascus sp. GIB2]|nr:hypothetical protein DL765_002291 [Monosporascus sp. GIB2]
MTPGASGTTFCLGCGGPLLGTIVIAQRPKRFARSERKGRASVTGSRESGKQDGPRKSGSQEEEEEEEGDYDHDETDGYNPGLISVDGFQWLKHTHIICSPMHELREPVGNY